MTHTMSKDTLGAWLIHHGRKVAMDTYGASDFPSIDEAAKAARLLSSFGETQKASLTIDVVQAVAKACGLNPRVELDPLLGLLANRRLIDRKGASIDVIGITTRSVLTHAADIFLDSEPSGSEQASITLAERASEAPLPRRAAIEYVSDSHSLRTKDTEDLVTRSERIGFVDVEGTEASRILFNGNLFRRDSIAKTRNVLDSLSSVEQTKLTEFGDMLREQGCAEKSQSERILGTRLFEKLVAAGVYDVNTVSNDAGEHVFVTSPDSFHKFVNPMVDDCFDMAKALVSALKYGMTMRMPSRGWIHSISLLLDKLIAGYTVGPATAIGMDYRVLELHRVVKIIPDRNLFRMRLLKKEVGRLALDVLIRGDANSTALKELPGAPMTGYAGPEDGRVRTRKQQGLRSRRATQDILAALRGGRDV